MNLIQLIDVKKSYLNKTFNLTIKKNNITIINGTNGSGKSTLVKLISGLLKKDTGKIIKQTNKIKHLQEVISFPENLIVSDYLRIMSKINRGNPDERLINEFKVPMDKKIFELSKGNKQKLYIITTFIGNNDLYILDEPLNGLDDQSIVFFIEYLKKLENISIIIVTHYLEKYLNVSNEVLNL